MVKLNMALAECKITQKLSYKQHPNCGFFDFLLLLLTKIIIFAPETSITMRQNRIFPVLLLLLGVALQAAAYSDHRNRKVDSIEAQLSSGRQLSDEDLMGAYKDLMWGYLNTDGERSAFYARKAVALSYHHEWQNSRADALRILGMIAYGGTDYDTALEYYNWALALTDSMRATGHYDETTVDDNYSALYGSIGNLYNMRDQLHLAIAYYQKALPYFEKYGWMESATILF